MMNHQELSLYIWGKHYPQITSLANNVHTVSAGENHFIFTTNSGETFGVGSNKFGQLGLKDTLFYKQPIRVFEKFKVQRVFCGSEHTFIVTDKYQVYSTGLNIKGQLGHSYFEDSHQALLVTNLLPFAGKNSKNIPKTGKSKQPILQILQKFDLQVKLDESQNICLLESQEFIQEISCGALFTLALSNKGRVFSCGFRGVNCTSYHDQLEMAKFVRLELGSKIVKIHSSLSGTVILDQEGRVLLLGRFGKMNYSMPFMLNPGQDKYYDCKAGDQFAVLLNVEGEVLTVGQNIDNQLGFQGHQISSLEQPTKVVGCPFTQQILVGRNNVFTIEAETGQVFAWGSNKYFQIVPTEVSQSIMGVTNLQLKLEEGEILIPSSYCTLLLSPNRTRGTKLFQKKQQQNKQRVEEIVSLSEYRKLLSDYQVLKGLNMTLLEKQLAVRKQSRQTQTISKFEISGVTQYRKFNENIEIAWKELQLQNQISEGGYGIIYKARWRELQVVVKKFKIENGEVSLRDFLSECHAMEAVRHPHIVMFLGAVMTNPHYSIILEYCSHGSLWSYIQNKENPLSWQDRRRFAIEIAQGVHYLHSCTPPILHRDLKSLNIFLDVALRIKIGDFGWTKTLDEYMTNKIGTYQWMAPEVIGSKPYTEKADVFSYSIILWQLAAREPPYKNISGSKVSEDVLSKQLRPTIPPKVPEAFVKLMKKCWQNDPNRRPSFKQILRELEVMKL